MLEKGISLHGQYPKGREQYLGRLMVTHLIVVCAHAEKNCPRIFPSAYQSWYWPFDDPAIETGSEEERLAKFREVRDQIQQKIREWLPVVEPHSTA